MSTQDERPLECGQCKKPIAIVYKEIIGEAQACSGMCESCPIFQQKLFGKTQEESIQNTWAEKDKGLCCEKCETSMEGVKLGQPLGCPQCYNVFSELILRDLLSSGKISPRLKNPLENKQTAPIHIGKSPHEVDFTLSKKLTTLNEALNEALKKENYEQAAWLRDQIKALMEQKEHG